ncbi:endonuclease/exonuclease/phosphatase family protein [Vitiosangium sp. GDMCC 1.1324]|uniref:endonuclease/exonuclease/phosphatase family protein n=1 Tax=Vitiosangium sp. (strain GDMCC 1.1324) TaxID=2138576 RepID=UPI000D389FCD|nr:endonuclease/exonuclease/phosphatase family protein [Vitiosangium sp. GDMCC 1.1324]PTL82982.1 endonuclease [Vitiosangium sp. GDMCC 1.1324]
MSRLRLSLLLLASLAAACGGTPENLAHESELATREDAVTIPAQGTASTLDFGNWNIEWFGSTFSGPTNESLQLSNVRDVISGADLDIWGLEEVVSTTSFDSLKSQLPGYAGFLANDATVTSGASYYSSSEQKVGILYKTSVASVLSARIILTANDYDFAGRPPLEVKLRVTLNGHTEDIVVIVLHAKAFKDTTSWQRRANASAALKSYLDSTYPTAKVMVFGDWNDDLDTSITSGKASPYQNLVSDSADYTFPTKALSDAHIATTTSYPDAIDHQLVTNELEASYVSGSVQAYRVDSYISNYSTTTTDHFPVLSRFTW